MQMKSFDKHYHLMLLPGMVLLVLFSIIPMLGIVIAFQNFIPAKSVWGSEWIGLDNFKFMFQIPDSKIVFTNTMVIAISKMILGLFASLAFALLLNEVRISWFKRTVQTIVYLPHFLSWVILSGILINILSLQGIMNQLLQLLHIESIQFLTSNTWFRPIVILSDTWKEFGFSAIIYLAAITNINPVLYEAASIDGASRLQKLWHITLSGILPTVILIATLNLGNILNANFDQIFNLYNPLVYSTGDVIDTYVYRVGLVETQYGLATAVGLLKSIVSFILIIVSYALASRFANYRIF